MHAVKEQVLLADFTTFKIGGPARYFVAVTTLAELQEALAQVKKNSWPVLVMAGGSNLIVSSKGFAGLAIYIQFGGIKISGHKLTAGAGATMAELVDASIAQGLGGVEWAGGLPGSFGGAIRGNAGAFGGEIKDNIETVTTINANTGQLKHWSNSDCRFAYRDSYFKQSPEEVIILATLTLKPGSSKQLRQTADEHSNYRKEKHPLEYPNAGSIFKNVAVEKIPAAVLEQWRGSIKNDPFPVVPTAKILSDAGLKGERVGDAELSQKHSNYIVNLGAATGEDVVALIQKIQAIIRQKYQIELEVEPELVGF